MVGRLVVKHVRPKGKTSVADVHILGSTKASSMYGNYKQPATLSTVQLSNTFVHTVGLYMLH